MPFAGFPMGLQAALEKAGSRTVILNQEWSGKAADGPHCDYYLLAITVRTVEGSAGVPPATSTPAGHPRYSNAAYVAGGDAGATAKTSFGSHTTRWLRAAES